MSLTKEQQRRRSDFIDNLSRRIESGGEHFILDSISGSDNTTASLDGDFDARTLRAIADALDAIDGFDMNEWMPVSDEQQRQDEWRAALGRVAVQSGVSLEMLQRAFDNYYSLSGSKGRPASWLDRLKEWWRS